MRFWNNSLGAQVDIPGKRKNLISNARQLDYAKQERPQIKTKEKF